MQTATFAELGLSAKVQAAVQAAGYTEPTPIQVQAIPVAVTGFAEGEASKQTEKYVGGKSLMNLPHYFGPCTPAGSPHHYTFTLIATDLEPGALQPGMTRDEVIKAVEGHAKGAAGIIGTFSKP